MRDHEMAWKRLLSMVTIGIFVGGLVKNCQAKDVPGAPCLIPSLIKKNFHNSIEVINTANRTLSCEIHSDTPIKGTPSWRYENSSHFPTRIKHSVETGSCSTSPSTTCTVSNLTLINVIRGEYDGNYSLTAENDCGTAIVYVYVNIMAQQNCTSNPNIPPQFKTHPPQIVETVEGDKNVVIAAQYEGKKDNANLGVYWCVYFTQHNYYCYNLTEDDGNFVVTTDGCPPYDSKCCYFTVILTIRSLTLDLSGIFLQSMVIWKYDPESFVKSNSTLVVNVRPTLDQSLSSLNKRCVERNEGQSAELTCIYNASTNLNITITTWRFNGELLKENLSHYTIITKPGGDPRNLNRVLSRLILSNLTSDNGGTYTCQCVYNSTAIAGHKDNMFSKANSYCLKVNPGKTWIIIGLVVGPTLFVLFILIVLLCCYCYWRRRREQKNCKKPSEEKSEKKPLLARHKPLMPVLSTEIGIESEPERPRRPPTPCLSGYLDSIAPEFVALVNVNELLPYLLQHQLLNRNEEEHLVQFTHTSIEKAQMLLGYLKRKGADGLQKFLCCLNLAHEHTGHKEVADKLKQLMEANGINCTNFCSDNCKKNCQKH